MALTFAEVKRIVAPYAGRAGKSVDSDETALFARKVMEYLLYSGSQAAIRKLCILANNGCVVLPPEVEVPLKVRIDRKVSAIWNKWYSFHSSAEGFDSCTSACDLLIEDGELTPIAYSLPTNGSLIGVMGTCEEGDSYVIVQGKDPAGRQIFTIHNGEKIPGEKLKIVKNQIRYGKATFKEITGILKPVTGGYVILYAVNPASDSRTFLADYAPSDTQPLYRKFLVNSSQASTIAHLSILCRVKLRDTYLDNELTLFDNALAIQLGAQRIQSESNNDANTANYKRQAVEDLLEKEAGYKKISGNPVDVFYPLSGGSIKNIVG